MIDKPRPVLKSRFEEFAHAASVVGEFVNRLRAAGLTNDHIGRVMVEMQAMDEIGGICSDDLVLLWDYTTGLERDRDEEPLRDWRIA